MSISENAVGYAGTAKALHWTIVTLLIVHVLLALLVPKSLRAMIIGR